MSVVNLVILLVNVAYVVDQGDVGVAAHPDFVGALAMDEVLVDDLLGAAVYRPVDEATAGHLHIVDVRRFHMLMETALGNVAEAEVDFESWCL